MLRRDGRLGARPDAQLPRQKASARPALPPIGEALQLLAKCAYLVLSKNPDTPPALRSILAHLVQPDPNESARLLRPHSTLSLCAQPLTSWAARCAVCSTGKSQGSSGDRLANNTAAAGAGPPRRPRSRRRGGRRARRRGSALPRAHGCTGRSAAGTRAARCCRSRRWRSWRAHASTASPRTTRSGLDHKTRHCCQITPCFTPKPCNSILSSARAQHAPRGDWMQGARHGTSHHVRLLCSQTSCHLMGCHVTL